MEIINPSSKDIQQYHDKNYVFVSFKRDETGLTFSRAAMKRFVLTPATRITFVVDIDRLYFYISKSEDEGFPISDGRHQSGIVCSRLLIRHIHKKLPSVKRNGPRFEMRLSPTQINGCITIEILISQRL